MAEFQKGHKKVGGRVKGTPNKDTKDIRDFFRSVAEAKKDEAIRIWEQIPEPEKKFKLYLEMCAFFVPKPQAIQLEANINKVSSIEDDLKDLSEE